MAEFLKTLRSVCSNVSLLSRDYFGKENYVYNTNFYIPSPKPIQPDDQRYIIIVGSSSYPDPNRSNILTIAKSLRETSEELTLRYELVQLYLTESEAQESEASKIEAPIIDFLNLGYGIEHQEINSRNVVEYLLASSIMCASLPNRVASWFRNSTDNRLGYILRFDDVEFQWKSSMTDLWMYKRPRGLSLEERDEQPKDQNVIVRPDLAQPN
ncbi:hypothetical protein [Aureimonas psammosilenae]|uniref:hypothetical protein n=1 Tax=Aureimonas psammosilenae TaxID=2495496 RepID=UPI00126120F0|nr:hypothetical protein [Aureimonas psammosilenae]